MHDLTVDRDREPRPNRLQGWELLTQAGAEGVDIGTGFEADLDRVFANHISSRGERENSNLHGSMVPRLRTLHTAIELEVLPLGAGKRAPAHRSLTRRERLCRA